MPDAISLPPMFRVRQHFSRPQVTDIPGEIASQLAKLTAGRVSRGQRVALAVGSRGIASLPVMVKTVIDELRASGAEPLIVPAMGSHGGGTPEGQTAMLATLGITPEAMECPIEAAMESPVRVTLPAGVPIHFSAAALAADHVIMLNRIKLHTGFAGPYQSGMAKMLLLGLGKHEGAKAIHAASRRFSFEEMVNAALPALLPTIPLLGGLAVIENAFEEVGRIQAVPAERILADEPALLEQATAWMPQLPFEEIDVLVIDRIGKNLSGTGLDTNVVSRKVHDNHAMPGERPAVHRIVARALTEETRGNALGVGLCEFITDRLKSAINFEYTYINAVTSNHVAGCKMPPSFPTDRKAIEAAAASLFDLNPAELRMVRIRSTLELTELEVSPALRAEVDANEDLETLSTPEPWAFDESGELADLEFRVH
ncbi:MAG: [Fe-S]-binding protein [Planctomycetaceae bacterium]|nr:[Fe-S]-binding protein [Planctomycetaceae bacterium]